jgi:hypothetical protein
MDTLLCCSQAPDLGIPMDHCSPKSRIRFTSLGNSQTLPVKNAQCQLIFKEEDLPRKGSKGGAGASPSPL